MNAFFHALFKYVVLVPAIIALVRYKKMDERYHPLCWLMWAGSFNELCNLWLRINGFKNINSTNAYSLVESLLVLILIHRMQLFHAYILPLVLAMASFLIWLAGLFITPGYNSFFFVINSMVLATVNLLLMHRSLIRTVNHPLRDSSFIISLSFVAYFMFTAVIEIFWLYGMHNQPGFGGRVFFIFQLINFFASILQAFALLWTPSTQKFIMQSS